MSRHVYITSEDIGNTVLCDVCNEDYTGRQESGGFLFGSKAYCPECAVNSLPSIKSYNELGYIKAWCPPDKSFCDWVLSLRNGDNTIKVTTIVEEP